jgi:hypothetical protein
LPDPFFYEDSFGLSLSTEHGQQPSLWTTPGESALACFHQPAYLWAASFAAESGAEKD